VFLPWLWYGISVNSKILNNKFMKYFSMISLEAYLSHMVMFRIVERSNINYLFGNNWTSFIVTFFMILIGLFLFITLWNKLYSTAQYAATYFNKKFLKQFSIREEGDNKL
jgi:hypothetical protein